jgi:hypothetical protein
VDKSCKDFSALAECFWLKPEAGQLSDPPALAGGNPIDFHDKALPN